MPYIALQLIGISAVLKTMGLNGSGFTGELPLLMDGAHVVFAGEQAREDVVPRVERGHPVAVVAAEDEVAEGEAEGAHGQLRGPNLRCGGCVGATGSIWTPAQAGWRPKAP